MDFAGKDKTILWNSLTLWDVFAKSLQCLCNKTNIFPLRFQKTIIFAPTNNPTHTPKNNNYT